MLINTNWLREKVSTNKIRMNKDGFNLDLTYITNRVIACGFPAVGIEGLYRNKRDDICRWLHERHGSMCKIYNLCGEGSYHYPHNDVKNFSLMKFPFADH
jgi:phosphatidylinositol-3,4,5-trisphosphate 3-phosphatase and dual-specificity protein phosphatase PTEN